MKYQFLLTLVYLLCNHLENFTTNCTIDVNTAHFEYLANHLSPEECRKLVAALHFGSFDLPNALYQSVRKVPRDLSCFQQLLHWNSERHTGQGATHEEIARRLKQINRDDLAAWITTAAFDTLHQDFERSISDPFRMYEPIHLPFINLSTVTTETTPQFHITTPQTLIRIAKQDLQTGDPNEEILIDPTEWTLFDTISWSIVIVLFLLVLVLVIYLTMASPCCNRKKRYSTPSPSTQCPATKYRTMPLQPECASPYQQHDCQQRMDCCPQQSPAPCEDAYASDKQHHHHHRKCTCHKHNHYQEVNDCAVHHQHVCHQPVATCGTCSRKHQCGEVPPPPRPICPAALCPKAEFESRPHFNNLSRTIDIHQKIAIPMNNLENSN